MIVHLGDFHAFLHFFGNVGKFVVDSGFEDSDKMEIIQQMLAGARVHGRSHQDRIR